MRKWLIVLTAVLVIGATGCPAQTTAVTATVTDTSGQIWTGATYQINFYPAPGTPVSQYTWQGVQLPANQLQFNGVLDGTGTFSVTLPDSLTITPKTSSWTFTICPLATTTQCSVTTTIATGATDNLSSVLSANLAPPLIAPTPINYAYRTSNVNAIPGIGQMFFNVTTLQWTGWNGNSWVPIGSGGGGSGTVTTFSAAALSPLFTTSVSNPTTTPALSFTLSNAGAFSLLFNNSASPAAPAYVSLSNLPVNQFPTLNQNTTGQAGSVANALTANSSGGAAPGTTFNGSAGIIFDYHSFGAAPTASPVFTGTVDASGATQEKLPVASGFVTLANGEMGFDTTNSNWHLWDGADYLVAVLPASSLPTSGDCVNWVKTVNSFSLGDAGAACGSGSGAVSSVSGTGIISNSTSTGAVTITWTGTSGGIPYFSSASTLVSSAALSLNHILLGGGAGGAPTSDANLDDGATTANTLTYAGVGGITASAGPVISAPVSGQAGLLSLSGNTTNPTCGTNKFCIFGFNSASATAYGWQASTTAPSGTQFMMAGTPVSGASPITYESTVAINQGGTGATTQQAAIDALAGTCSVTGCLLYNNGNHWVVLNGNNSGTLFLSENASGVPSWSSSSSGGVSSLASANTNLTLSASTGAITATVSTQRGVNAVVDEGMATANTAAANSTAFSNWANAVSATGKNELWVPCGTYNLNPNILVQLGTSGGGATLIGNLTVVGEAKASGNNNGCVTFNFTGGTAGTDDIWLQNSNSSPNNRGVSFSNITFQDSVSGVGSRSGIRVSNNNNIYFHNVNFINYLGASYSTGTCTATNGSTAVVCSGSTIPSAVGNGTGFLWFSNEYQEICSWTDATHITLCSNWTYSTQTAQAYNIDYNGVGFDTDGVSQSQSTQYGLIEDMGGFNNRVCMYGQGNGSSTSTTSRLIVLGGWCSGNRVPDSVGLHAGRFNDTWTLYGWAVNNVAIGVNWESAHANQVWGAKMENTGSFTVVNTCNGGVAAQSCVSAYRMVADASNTGKDNQIWGGYAYSWGTGVYFGGSINQATVDGLQDDSSVTNLYVFQSGNTQTQTYGDIKGRTLVNFQTPNGYLNALPIDTATGSLTSGDLASFSGTAGLIQDAGIVASNVTQTIAHGTAAMGTSAIASGTCATVVTVSASGVATTDTIKAGFNGDPTAVTGYGVSGTGAVLTIYPYPTANNINFKVCNSSSGSITPGSLTLNWTVQR